MHKNARESVVFFGLQPADFARQGYVRDLSRTPPTRAACTELAVQAVYDLQSA